MPLFQYIGYYDRFYGGVKAADGRDLFVHQGDTAELDVPPQDGMWIAVDGDTENTPVTVPETAPAALSGPLPVDVPEPVPAGSPAVSEPAAAPTGPQVYVNPNTQPPAVVH